MFTFFNFNKKLSPQNKPLLAENKKANDLKIKKIKKVKSLLNYPFPIETEQNILSFLSFTNLYLLLTVNQSWKKQIKTLIHAKYMQKHFSNALMYDAQQIAIHLRKNLDLKRALRLAPQYYTRLRRLRTHQDTRLVSTNKLNDENNSLLFTKWIKNFHNLNIQPAPTSIKINYLFSMILFSLCTYKQFSDIATMQRIYPQIDTHLKQNGIHIERYQDCQPFLDAYNNIGIYGFAYPSSYRVIRDTTHWNCGPEKTYTWTIHDIAEYCEKYPNYHLSFSFVPLSPKLRHLIQECKENSLKIATKPLYYFASDKFFNPSDDDIFFHGTQITFNIAYFLIFLFLTNKIGLFNSVKNFIANCSIDHFFSANKRLINESKHLLKLQEEMAKEKAHLEFKM